MPSSQTPSIAGTAIDPTALRPPIDDAEIVRIAPSELYAKLEALRAEGFSMLLDIGGVDYLGREPRYDVVYHLLALPTVAATVAEIGKPRRLRLLVGVPAEETVLPSAIRLWPSADWAEREIYDLFGITFTGHPDLRRIQLPYDWVGHPLRKDYPLRGPGREATPRPPFALKSNVPAGTPPSGKVAAALQKQIARARGQTSLPRPTERRSEGHRRARTEPRAASRTTVDGRRRPRGQHDDALDGAAASLDARRAPSRRRSRG